ncbi:hypothetical protein IWW38_000807 [Coemansia aciculifera]|uniref:Uncharacterized protein n=1 Tax=Coemansia aciculifera TaxID=417176 RepID=A0ACC1MA19_9FUNG|nr:hypothetical protein IWW38_000807 [Coemansia aciculifera]
MMGATTKLTLSDVPGMPDDGQPLLNAIYAAPNSSFLRSLKFEDLVFDLCHIIRVVAALPTLVSFTCIARGESSNTGDIPANERLSSLRAQHYPLSNSFKVLRVPYESDAAASNLAILAMQLTVLCPNFSRVDMPPKLRNEFSREVAWSICNASFKPYADSLCHLIYQDLND